MVYRGSRSQHNVLIAQLEGWYARYGNFSDPSGRVTLDER